MSTPFGAYRQRLERNMRELAASLPSANFDEQAVPSYTHGNRLMAWFFWQRIRRVMRYLDDRMVGRALDFGCGTGVLLPYLQQRAEEVVGFDLNLEAVNFTARNLGLDRVTLESDFEQLRARPSGSFDTILALDVLEHVEDLGGICQEFSRLLSHDGVLIVSGPTETPLYRLGRWLAGFKSHFHVRNIYHIEQEMKRHLKVRRLSQLYWPFPLFWILTARRGSRPD